MVAFTYKHQQVEGDNLGNEYAIYEYTNDAIFYYSVKLKHFKKFEDMTEALSGNTTMVLFFKSFWQMHTFQANQKELNCRTVNLDFFSSEIFG